MNTIFGDKKKFILIFVFIMLGSHTLCAQTLFGYVRELNSGNKPISNVLVKGISANQVLSTDKGEYTLHFQGGKAGQTVYITVEKEGWLVTDKSKLRTNLPSSPSKNPHIIVVCQKDNWDKLLRNSKDICEKGMRDSYEKKITTLNGQIKSLNKNNKNYQATIDSLHRQIEILTEQYNYQQEKISEIAENHSRQNLDEITEKEKQAYLLFNEGKIDESLALRESMNSIENIERRNAENAALKQTLANNDAANLVDRRNLKQQAKDAQLLFQMDIVERNLEYLARDTTDLDAVYEYGVWLFNNYEIEKSNNYLKYYYKQVCKKNVYGTYNLDDKLIIPFEMIEKDPALIMYIMVSRSLSDNSEKQNWFDLYNVMSYNQRNKLYDILIREKTKLDFIDIKYDIKQYYIDQKYQSILKKEARTESEAIALNNLVNRFYKTALIFLNAYINNPKTDKQNKSSFREVYHKQLMINTNELSIDSLFLETIKIYQLLVLEDVDTYSSFYSEALTLIFDKLEKFDEKKNRLNEILLSIESNDRFTREEKIYLSMALTEPFEEDYGRLMDFSICFYNKYIQKLEEDFPEKHELRLTVLQKLCDYYSKLKNYKTCVNIMKTSINILKKHATISDVSNFKRYGYSLGILSWYYLMTNNPTDAEKAVREALNPVVENMDYDKEIEWVKTNLAHSLLMQGKYKEAESIYSSLKNKQLRDNTFKDYFLGDIEEFEKNGITNPDFERIKKMLKE